MAEARAATLEPKVRFHDEGTSEIEQETKVAKSFFQDLKLCAVRTRWVLETAEPRGVPKNLYSEFEKFLVKYRRWSLL